jgi:antitoxin (DNA-binding transcriptional repressor) of toxin-antitoxin stability system
MTTHVSATKAVRSFSDILNRIRYRAEEFVVERGGEPVCRMTPAAPVKRLSLRDLAALLREIPEPDSAYASGVRRAARSQRRLPQSPWGR